MGRKKKKVGDDEKRMKCMKMFEEREGGMYLRMGELCGVIYLRKWEVVIYEGLWMSE